MTITIPDSFESAALYIFSILTKLPMLQLLLIFIILDICSGILVAINKKTLNSTTSWRGMTRKAMSILMWAACHALRPHSGAIPIDDIVAFAYCISEFVSITENSAAVGLPVPEVIKALLEKLRQDNQKRAGQKSKLE